MIAFERLKENVHLKTSCFKSHFWIVMRRGLVIWVTGVSNISKPDQRQRGERRKQARKPRSYASDLLTGVKCRATSVAKNSPSVQFCLPSEYWVLLHCKVIYTRLYTSPHPEIHPSIRPSVHLEHHGATSIWDGIFS